VYVSALRFKTQTIKVLCESFGDVRSLPLFGGGLFWGLSFQRNAFWPTFQRLICPVW
jgi:hypothetical protein